MGNKNATSYSLSESDMFKSRHENDSEESDFEDDYELPPIRPRYSQTFRREYPSRPERKEREYPSRSERKERPERPERKEREYSSRSEREEREYSSRSERKEREYPSRSERKEREYPSRSERKEREYELNKVECDEKSCDNLVIYKTLIKEKLNPLDISTIKSINMCKYLNKYFVIYGRIRKVIKEYELKRCYHICDNCFMLELNTPLGDRYILKCIFYDKIQDIQSIVNTESSIQEVFPSITIPVNSKTGLGTFQVYRNFDEKQSSSVSKSCVLILQRYATPLISFIQNNLELSRKNKSIEWFTKRYIYILYKLIQHNIVHYHLELNNISVYESRLVCMTMNETYAMKHDYDGYLSCINTLGFMKEIFIHEKDLILKGLLEKYIQSLLISCNAIFGVKLTYENIVKISYLCYGYRINKDYVILPELASIRKIIFSDGNVIRYSNERLDLSYVLNIWPNIHTVNIVENNILEILSDHS